MIDGGREARAAGPPGPDPGAPGAGPAGAGGTAATGAGGSASAGAIASPWSPLRSPLFRALWMASVVSFVGTWMQDVGAAWLMTSLTKSPVLVALLQAAATLPLFLLAVPSGALADVVDRRRLLIFAQIWMTAAAALLGVLAVAGAVTPSILLGATFLLGLGAAVNAPAWQAIIPELVSGQELAAALSLQGAGINLARAVGPALGGLVVAAAGPGAAFLLNAVSFLGVVVVLYAWRREHHPSVLPAERILGAMSAGLRYVRHAPDLRAVMIRSSTFIVFGSALWALLPLVVRFELGLGPTGYGLLLGCLGAGAVAGAVLVPWLRRRLAVGTLVAGASVVFALALLGMAFIVQAWAMGVVMFAAGVAWLALLTSFHTAAQTVLPGWVRGRGLSIYLLVLFGGMAAGSALWGAVAKVVGPSAALASAALGILAGLAATVRFSLSSGEGLNLTPSRHWPAPVVSGTPVDDDGPVMVTVEYHVEPRRAHDFARAMRDVRRIRLRDGAIRWNLLNDSADPSRYVESFLVESWVEHLRQHERVTVADREIEARARAFHIGASPPVVSHFIARALPR